MSNYLITGGAGFIGSCFTRYMAQNFPEHSYVVLDKLTYAGNLENIEPVKDFVQFVHGDIADEALVPSLFEEHKFDVVVNFAAETHVDRSIGKPDDFIKTDIFGTYVLLEAAKNFGVSRFVQISTDEVYGDIPEGYSSVETDALMPRNPYSASKAGADRLAYSYFATYNVPVIITRCSNNYGPYQYPEKLIPLFITNLLQGEPVPLYGDGQNIRDWIYVEDHARAIQFLIEKGKDGDVYNISADQEKTNRQITEILLNALDKGPESIRYVEDRKGHDRRYSLNSSKLSEMGFEIAHPFEQKIAETIAWYRQNTTWWEKIKSGEFKEYYQNMYAHRLEA